MQGAACEFGQGGPGEGELMAGWLIKSPPLENKKPLFNPVTPKWRRRWFVLREGGMPGQYLLQYYTDHTARKLKGTIDLDQCFQVDTGLTYTCGKVSLSHLFNITTQKRIYYLSASSLQEMNAWVQSLCQACGLRPYQTEEEEEKDESTGGGLELRGEENRFSDGQTSQTHISGPYMHLSECFTGGGAPATSSSSHVRNQMNPGLQRKQSQNILQTSEPQSLSVHPSSRSPGFPSLNSVTPDSSLNCGDDSVFLPNSPAGSKSVMRHSDLGTPAAGLRHSDLGSTGPRPTDLGSQLNSLQIGGHVPPGRPPKPDGLRHQTSVTQGGLENYENLQTAQRMMQQGHQTSQRKAQQTNQRETMSSNNNNNTVCEGKLSQPTGAPQVDRRLKPSVRHPQGDSATLPVGRLNDRKLSHQFDTLPSTETWRATQFSRAGTLGRTSSVGSVSLGSRRNSEEEETIYYYMPSLQNTNTEDGRWGHIMIPAQDMIGQSIEYLDLDLPSPARQTQPKEIKSSEECPSTVYKTVDFIKTEAFNRTKKNVEHQRYNIQQS